MRMNLFHQVLEYHGAAKIRNVNASLTNQASGASQAGIKFSTHEREIWFRHSPLSTMERGFAGIPSHLKGETHCPERTSPAKAGRESRGATPACS